MRKHKYYKDTKTGLKIDRPVACVRRNHSLYFARPTPAMIGAAAARMGFRKTRKPHTIAHPAPTRRYLARLRRAALNPGRRP